MTTIILKPWIADRVLQFFNRVKTIEDITEAVKDNPFEGHSEEKKGYGIGTTLAERILNYRNTLPGRRFRNLEQIWSINGLGEDKINDLIYSFDVPADELFKQYMYDNVIADNWELDYFSMQLSDTSFEEVIIEENYLRDKVIEMVTIMATQRNGYSPTSAQLAPLSFSFIETYQNPHFESFAFGLWFYRFDADNWFSFEEVQEATERYLDTYFHFDHRLELHLFKGFKNGGLLTDGISVDDLPVVVNHAEKIISIWTAQLND